MGINSEIIRGHDLLAVERFRDNTRHMIIFDVLTLDSPMGEKDQRQRLFLDNEGCAKAQESQRKGEIIILRYASIIGGILSPTRNLNTVMQYNVLNTMRRPLGLQKNYVS